MSIDVQTAPNISQIALDRSENDLQFRLDESGVITTKNLLHKAEKINKNKEPISKGKIEDMASKYSDYYDSYDEDFEEDSPDRHVSRARKPEHRTSLSRNNTRSDISLTPPRRTKRTTDSRKNSLVSYRSAYGNSRATNKPSKKKTKKSQSASTRPFKTDEASNMVQRILSANRNKITKLYNTVEELQQEVEHLKQENRTLKRVHIKQERELKHIEKAETCLPQLLQRHSAELRTYRERLKRNKMDISRKEKESHDNDLEINKLRDKVQHYKSLDDDKKLEERASLARKLEKVENALAERDTKIMELRKTITLTEKARQREIKEQQEKHKKATEDLKRVREDVVSLREKLKEKEKQLDMTNIYHQNTQKKLKKSNPLALLPAQQEDLQPKKENESTVSHSEKNRHNIFITNGPSETSSVTAESEIAEKDLSKNRAREIERNDVVASRSLELEKLEERRLRETLEREERRRKEEEDARKRDKEMKREQDMEWERMRKLKEDKKREEEERKREEERIKQEEMMRKRQEEGRMRMEKEEQDRLKFKEDDETRRKKDMLLARMKAIDAKTKPNEIIDVDLSSKSQDDKPKKLPIFLQSSESPKVSGDSQDNEKPKNGSTGSLRSKHSQSSSYDFKETIKNLHHGLPAHPSDQHLRSVGSKGRRDSIGEENFTFGSYKPTVGKGETKKTETFGSYNPSFSESKKDTGLDFSKKHEQKTSPPPKENDLVFGSYQPTFSGSSSKNNDIVDGSTRRGARRGQADQKSHSIFGDELFGNNTPKENKRNSLFSQDSWEKKASVSKPDESLLPRRQKVQQSLSKGHEQNVPAVGNALNDTIDDDIEEVTL